MFGARAAAAEVGPPPLAPQPYRVFISYSHRADAALAEALAATLTRFARPWWAPRAMKVFLDKTSMASDDSLARSIQNGLARCEWLLLLACPESASSPWVQQEIAWWVANRPLARLVIAHTGGTIAWHGIDGDDFDWTATDALPAEPLRNRFAREPLWADLRAAAAAKRKRLGDADYRAGFLNVAARIHGVSKDALWNLERGEQRVRVVVAVAALLAIVAFVLVARNQRRISDERDENIDSINLGAKALRVLPSDPMLAAQIALAGMQPRASGTAANAFRAAVAALAGPTAPSFETALPDAVALAWSPQAARLAVVDRRGTLTLLDAA
ncbi:MAG TPA: TIR domain-containing protein, partial [Burkholderiaceae bacterium]|nr:TIR domain-containing protein [Burkholderiaceae bacterium]